MCGSHLFSAVLSMACILSSIVDLIKNLWTNVGLWDREKSRDYMRMHRYFIQIVIANIVQTTIYRNTSIEKKSLPYNFNFTCLTVSIFKYRANSKMPLLLF